MTFRKDLLQDFIASCGTARAAAQKIGLNESTLSLILSEKRALLPEHAVRIEEASTGAFRADALLPEVTFLRADGRITGHVVPHANSEKAA